jgi:exopolyphosphatase/guanosine-5'-triphosphate,3'-diphosphate pyrophosphatase
LVVFERHSRAAIPIFNEKSLPALGQGLEKTGTLHRAGIDTAITAIQRFCAIADAMGVTDLTLLATAAVRDATDGPAFKHIIEKETGREVKIISGAAEARYSALGVVAGMPEADGIMGDLGGGSLELVALERGRIGRHVTLPIGPLRLIDKADDDLARARELVEKTLDTVSWLTEGKGRHFYPVGGTWRSLAKIHIAFVRYPLHIIHEYRLSHHSAASIADILGHFSKKTLSGIGGFNRRRTNTLPYGAMILECLLRRIKPADVVFSAYGLREGYLFDHLPERHKREDPLLAGCRDLTASQSRFAAPPALFEWIGPLFQDVDTPLRIIEASCILSDMAWREHPDYRAEHAFLRTLRAPVAGISHSERVLLAIALAIRYGGSIEDGYMAAALPLIGDADMLTAQRVGRALRLAYALSAGTATMLEHGILERTEDKIVLALSATGRNICGETVQKRLTQLAELYSLGAEILSR